MRYALILVLVLSSLAIPACGASINAFEGEMGIVTKEDFYKISGYGCERFVTIAERLMHHQPAKRNITFYAFKSLKRQDVAREVVVYRSVENNDVAVGVKEDVINDLSNNGVAIFVARAIVLSSEVAVEKPDYGYIGYGDAVRLAHVAGYNARTGTEEACKTVDPMICWQMQVALAGLKI